MGENKKIYEIAANALEELKDVIEKEKFDPLDALEFVKTFKEDITEMLDNKLKNLDIKATEMIKAEKDRELAQEVEVELDDAE